MKKLIKKIIVIFMTFGVLISNTVLVSAVQLSDVKYRIEPKIVRIENDSYLKDYLNETSRANYIIAKDVKQKYYNIYKTDIKISEESMAVEILGHVFPEKVAKYLPAILRNKILAHTSVIDIGEKSVDSNRWVWDSIAAVIGNKQDNKRVRRSVVSIDDKVNDIIINNPQLKLDRQIIKKVLEDIEDGTIDPALLNI